MNTGKFNESQIVSILKQKEAGMKTTELCCVIHQTTSLD